MINHSNDKIHKILCVHMCVQREIKSEQLQGSPGEANNQFTPAFTL